MMVALSKLDLDDNKNIKKSLATIKQYNTKDPYKSKIDNTNQNFIPKEIEEQVIKKILYISFFTNLIIIRKNDAFVLFIYIID